MRRQLPPEFGEPIVDVVEARGQRVLQLATATYWCVFWIVQFNGWLKVLAVPMIAMILSWARSLARPRHVVLTENHLAIGERSWPLAAVGAIFIRHETFWKPNAMTVHLKGDPGDIFVPPLTEDGFHRVAAALDTAITNVGVQAGRDPVAPPT